MPKKAFSEEHLFDEHTSNRETRMGDAERIEWKRLAAALRRSIAASVELDTDQPTLASLADHAEAVAGQLERHAGTRGIPLFGGGAESLPDTASSSVPFSPVMGQLNPISPPLVLHIEEGKVAGTVTLGATYEGAPGIAHGAIVAAIYDEVLALANSVAGSAGATGRLTIHYRRPTPLGVPLRFEAWTDRVVERKIHAQGRCFAGNDLVSEAQGLFIGVRRGAPDT